MRGQWTRAAAVFAASSAIVMAPVPAHATVHEIIASWCSQNGPAFPPGISGGSNADNFAKPLFASGFIGDPVPFDPPGAQPAGLLITFNYDNPNAKVIGLGTYFSIGTTPDGPLYVENIAPNPDFAAFVHCPALAG